MTILSIIPEDAAGQVGVKPRKVSILCTNDLNDVVTAGFLNSISLQGNTIYPTDIIFMIYSYSTTTGNGIFEEFTVSVSNGIITLVPYVSPGSVLLPVTSGDFANFIGTSGQIFDAGYSPTDNNRVKVTMFGGNASVGLIANFATTNGTINGSIGGAIFNFGDIQAGISGTGGALWSFPPTASRGSLQLKAIENTGNTATFISNSAMGQTSTISIPDPGASTANFLLDAGPANLLTYQEMIGTEGIIGETTGTWSVQRNGAGDWVLTKAASAEIPIIGIDILPAIRTATSKGFELSSIDVIYGIAGTALNAHTASLTRATYANNAVTTLTNVPLTGSLATATQTDLYVSNLSVTTPAFINTGLSKYVFEVTLNAAAGTDYAFYGINLHFTQTIA